MAFESAVPNVVPEAVPKPLGRNGKNLKVAIVHEWLETYAGSERVLEQIIRCYPSSDLFALVDFLPADARAFLAGKKPITTFIQKLPFASRSFRTYLPLMPIAIEQLDLSAYDLVISNSHAVAKGVLCGPDQLHVSYVHTPIRYAWDMQHQYLQETGLDRRLSGLFARYLLHKLRVWDARTANGVDHFACNSEYIARRIRKAYRRDATVIYPPVNTAAFRPGTHKDDFFLTASRMVPYKKMDLVVEAFARMPDKKLVVIGDGPQMKKLKARASGNVSLLGYQPFDVLRDHMQRARAFVFAAEEDFGILPVEVQACGTPIIAYARGGSLETVRPLGSLRPTGLFFDRQTPEAIVAAVSEFERNADSFLVSDCVTNASGFSEAAFRRNFAKFVETAYLDFAKAFA